MLMRAPEMAPMTIPSDLRNPDTLGDVVICEAELLTIGAALGEAVVADSISPDTDTRAPQAPETTEPGGGHFERRLYPIGALLMANGHSFSAQNGYSGQAFPSLADSDSRRRYV